MPSDKSPTDISSLFGPEPGPEPKRKPGRPRKAAAKKAPAKRASSTSTRATSSTTSSTTPPADPPPAAPRPPGRPSVTAKRAERAERFIRVIGKGAGKFNERDGQIINEGAAELAIAIAEMAEQNKTVAKVCDVSFETGASLNLLIAVGGIAGAIAVNHGALEGLLALFRSAPPADTFAVATAAPSPVDPFGGFVATTPEPKPWEMPFVAEQ